jgi:hypothetical protein
VCGSCVCAVVARGRSEAGQRHSCASPQQPHPPLCPPTCCGACVCGGRVTQHVEQFQAMTSTPGVCTTNKTCLHLTRTMAVPAATAAAAAVDGVSAGELVLHSSSVCILRVLAATTLARKAGQPASHLVRLYACGTDKGTAGKGTCQTSLCAEVHEVMPGGPAVTVTACCDVCMGRMCNLHIYVLACAQALTSTCGHGGQCGHPILQCACMSLACGVTLIIQRP